MSSRFWHVAASGLSLALGCAPAAPSVHDDARDAGEAADPAPEITALEPIGNGRLRVVSNGAPTRVRIDVPERADDFARIEDESGVWLGFRLKASTAREPALEGGRVVYRSAGPNGSNLTLKLVESGIEDALTFADNATSEVEYLLDVRGTSGLRFVAQSIEFCDADNDPRLRMGRPTVVDARGRHAAVRMEIESCAYDANAAAPWGRPVVPPGADECTVRMHWDATGLLPPIVLDPPWTSTGSMADKRYLHADLTLGDGRIFTAGGYDGSATPALSGTELYNPGTGTWAATGNMLVARSNHAMALLASGKVLTVGGAQTGVVAYSSAELWDPATGVWSTTSNMAAARSNLTATTLTTGKVLVAGGQSATAELYDPATSTWSLTGSPGLRATHTTTRLTSGRVLLVGGGPAQIYDPTAGTWSSAGSTVSAHTAHTASLLLDGSVLVTGGGNSSSEIYNPTTNQWSATAPMSRARSDHTAAVRPNGVVVVTGGRNGGTTESSTESYNPQSGRWWSSGSMLTARDNHGSAALASGKVLVFGGWSGSGQQSTAELFDTLALGASCTTTQECVLGYCVDGVCCDAACGGSCVACTLAKKGSGANGACGPIIVGTDPDGECPTTTPQTCGTEGMCNGVGGCRLHASGIVCVAPACNAGVTTVAECDGSGACQPRSVPCAPYVCASSSSCGTTCDSDAECQGASWCRVGDRTCQPRLGSGSFVQLGCPVRIRRVRRRRVLRLGVHGTLSSVHFREKGHWQRRQLRRRGCGRRPRRRLRGIRGPTSCGTDGACNGIGGCRLYALGTACGNSCANGVQSSSTCDGLGACKASPDVPCEPHLCAGGRVRNELLQQCRLHELRLLQRARRVRGRQASRTELHGARRMPKRLLCGRSLLQPGLYRLVSGVQRGPPRNRLGRPVRADRCRPRSGR